MHTPTAPKKRNITFTVTTDLSKVARGHTQHRSGAGKHKHKCANRLGTRNARNRAAMQN